MVMEKFNKRKKGTTGATLRDTGVGLKKKQNFVQDMPSKVGSFKKGNKKRTKQNHAESQTLKNLDEKKLSKKCEAIATEVAAEFGRLQALASSGLLSDDSDGSDIADSDIDDGQTTVSHKKERGNKTNLESSQQKLSSSKSDQESGNGVKGPKHIKFNQEDDDDDYAESEINSGCRLEQPSKRNMSSNHNKDNNKQNPKHIKFDQDDDDYAESEINSGCRLEQPLKHSISSNQKKDTNKQNPKHIKFNDHDAESEINPECRLEQPSKRNISSNQNKDNKQNPKHIKFDYSDDDEEEEKTEEVEKHQTVFSSQNGKRKTFDDSNSNDADCISGTREMSDFKSSNDAGNKNALSNKPKRIKFDNDDDDAGIEVDPVQPVNTGDTIKGSILDGASGPALERMRAVQFRMINEELYTKSSKEAAELFVEDPLAFELYHGGYRSQVSKWPMNPLDKVIAHLKTRPKKWVVADMGCGDARLALELESRMKVYSFDFIALNDRVTPCNIRKVPLESNSVNCVVFCLSLMGTDLARFLLEANRILRMTGLLKIVEIESRFFNIDGFIRAVGNYGFRLQKKDISHKMFVFMDFNKVSAPITSKITPLRLNPCLYKKR